ncbi:semaphorin-4D-like [Paramormyrops kingsleyae]|uniref:semaphorin-4D-like n=1 Tax=Paramormyrops kingsleyae TaxID=1676925 RepID=UPI003B97AFCD
MHTVGLPCAGPRPLRRLSSLRASEGESSACFSADWIPRCLGASAGSSGSLLHTRDAKMLRVALLLFLSLPVNSTFGAAAPGPTRTPRTSWKRKDVSLLEFSEPGTFNYSTLLLQEDKGVLYVGAREAIFELNLRNVSVMNRKAVWNVPDKEIGLCAIKGKSKETDCLNYIRVLEVQSDDRLYVCGTHAFQPMCDFLFLGNFTLEGTQEDGKGKCSFDPAQSFTTVMVDGNLYSGTAYNFLGSEPIISRNRHPQGTLRTEYSTSWLNEPSFVFSDVVRENKGSTTGDDDKIYFFFTEVSVEYDFLGKLFIPRIARVCKGDLGGQRTLQKKWTSFLKAKLLCLVPKTGFIFNTVRDVFILKRDDWRESVIYGVFTSQWDNVESSAVCAYSMSAVQEVFSKGKYMQKTTVQQSHTKWVRYNSILPTPRPGACVSISDHQQGINSSLDLPDKTLQFVRDHPLLEDPVLPIGNSPKLIAKDVHYVQIAVERVQALDGQQYDVMFIGTDKGILRKSVVFEDEVHVIEEMPLLSKSETIKTLVLPSNGARFLYVGSDSGVVQAPTALCEKYSTCEDCLLARDPYCAWDSGKDSCVSFHQEPNRPPQDFIQSLKGDADQCPKGTKLSCQAYEQMRVQPGSTFKLPCQLGSNKAKAMWKFNGKTLNSSQLHQYSAAGLVIYSMGPDHQGCYECWALEEMGDRSFSWLLHGFQLGLDLRPQSTMAGLDRGLGRAMVPKESSASQPLGPNDSVLILAPPIHLATVPPVANTPHVEPGEASANYLQSNGSTTVLLFFTLLFCFLFLATVSYNCYMQYLPGPCLSMRAALLGRKKSPPQDYQPCETGLVGSVAQQKRANGVSKDVRDTGCEKGPSGAPPSHTACTSTPTEEPFDADCERQPIEYADADIPP